MKSGDTFTHTGGRLYTVLDTHGPDTLVSYDTGNDIHYAVLWRLHEHKDGLFTWDQGHYFLKDKDGAARFLERRRKERGKEGRDTFVRQR